MGISQLFDKFYEPDSSPTPEIGSVYWVPTSEVTEVINILQVKRATPQEHQITDFEFVEINSDHFKSTDRLPVKRLNLGDSQELVVTKAKKRPCVVLGKATIPPSQIESISDGAQRRQAKHLKRSLYLVAPFYSCAKYSENSTFGPILTARVKALMYPHLCYMAPLNPNETASNPGSIIRLDQVFPTSLGRGTEKADLKVVEDLMEIILGQFQVVSDLPEVEALTVARELVKDCLPEEVK